MFYLYLITRRVLRGRASGRSVAVTRHGYRWRNMIKRRKWLDAMVYTWPFELRVAAPMFSDDEQTSSGGVATHDTDPSGFFFFANAYVSYTTYVVCFFFIFAEIDLYFSLSCRCLLFIPAARVLRLLAS